MNNINHEIILNGGDYTGMSLLGVDRRECIEMYTFMVRLRRLQEAIIDAYHPDDEMKCPVHFCIGEEAVSAALSQVVQENDYLFGPHRSHAYYFAKGGEMGPLVAELYGKETGTNAGLAGSQEISNTEIHYYSGAILTGLVGIATGVGLGLKLDNKKDVMVVCMGDGAVDEGLFWESINYAQLNQLPVVYICENNRYSTYSPQESRQVAQTINARVAAFGMKTRAMFGNDVVQLKNVLRDAIDFARSGKGPFFLETFTYRWKGHVGPEDDDDVGYRSPDELAYWKRNCPIALLENAMTNAGYLEESEKTEIIKIVDKEIAGAFDFAQLSRFMEEVDWYDQNYSTDSPLADKLLVEIDANDNEFNISQPETRPAPY